MCSTIPSSRRLSAANNSSKQCQKVSTLEKSSSCDHQLVSDSATFLYQDNYYYHHHYYEDAFSSASCSERAGGGSSILGGGRISLLLHSCVTLILDIGIGLDIDTIIVGSRCCFHSRVLYLLFLLDYYIDINDRLALNLL